ncbi:Peptidase S8/S53, subtilisin/kexin/sedolisin [Metarhizium album ARSEF 1941]|uniref:tripeptidyl-peptidase II n=1 Tax=Metarhizium album (strain ARSEF 1941) TaxID=1081103 RepID=A0A0B2X2P0_METAS|nr:Peptidase S8/S53, subtilisin/kexin/sedolisin [Metarhizium album ARSEF 1941]KHO00564.1 Peptidase S8/S53, subtilisin/kexin/sedolisin [Metarhizium album ARSEF 1941]
MKTNLVFLKGLFAGAIAASMGSDTVHEKRDVSSSRWTKREAVDANTKVPVRIALKQKNLDKGMDYLLEVSDPSSAKYGRHYSKDQVVELFAPDEGAINSVKSWLTKSGVSADSMTSPKSKGWVDFQSTVGQLESILKTKYHMYDHIQARNAHMGADEYSLPSDISDLVDFITPGVVMSQTTRPSPEAKRSDGRILRPHKPLSAEAAEFLAAHPNATDSCAEYITPACIKSRYNISDGALHHDSNRMGIFETSDDVYSQEDLDSFYSKYAPRIPQGTGPKKDLIDGATAPVDQDSAGGESDLDLEIAIPIIYPQGAELYEAATRKGDIFNTFLDAVDGSYCNNPGDDPAVDRKTPDEMCGTFKAANVISFSYGTAEADYPVKYLQRQCDEFMKLGLQGTSVVFSSGDDGVARRSGPCLGPDDDIFTPSQQASCPYVTAVGSTVLLAGGEEIATESFSSGGGFSNIWPTPDYQKDAVAASYTTQDGTIPTIGGGIYNRAGRGYPDVAALGDNGVVVVGGRPGTSGGTSMSAPLVAAIFTRINDERIQAGKAPIGFANPALYKNPAMFTDVVKGDQAKGGPDGDGQPSACGNKGFSAVPGWDPVTGLGTPVYPAMLEYFLGL